MTSKKNRGLGKGIGALFPGDSFDNEATDLTQQAQAIDQEAEEAEANESGQNQSGQDQVQEIHLDEIRPNPYQPRTEFDPTALQELADSIEEQGLLQPITLRKSAIKGYEIIAGERRFRAMKLAGYDSIPALVRDMTDAQMIETAIIENLQREDLTPLEEAQAYRNLMDELDLTQAEAAKRLGKSRSHLANTLRLLDLNEDVKELLQNKKLSMGQARTLLGLKNKKDQSRLAKKVVDEGITVRHLEKLVQNLNEPVQPAPKVANNKSEKPTYLLEGEEHLMDKFGTNVQIKPKGQAGKIEIEYLSQEDLTRILDILDIRFDDWGEEDGWKELWFKWYRGNEEAPSV